jgi:putative transposase
VAEGEDGAQDHAGISALKKHYWGQHMWERGYFCCSTGNVTDEVIAEYIAHQQDDRDDDFKVDG